MRNKLLRMFILLFLIHPFLICGQNDDNVYNKFYQRVKENEEYIGFFAAEEKFITNISDEYISARREFFIGVRECEEDPEKFIEPFVDFCKSNNIIKGEYEEDWERVLTILSYELYANKPIFEFSADNISEFRNIIFAEYPNKKLALDLFLPKQPIEKPIPCIVCIHGGGWRVNRRIWFEPFAKYLASKGFAAATIDYRLLPAVKIIDCVYDSKASVRWIRANAKKYGIDPDWIGVIGASAGAQLAALLGTTADVSELEGTGGNLDVSSSVQAVVGIATPGFNLKTSENFAKEFGLTLYELMQVSPYENISSTSAPICLIHGTVDKTVDPQNSQDIYDKYKEAGVFAELKWIQDKDHGFYEGTDIAIKMASKFFTSQFESYRDDLK